MLTKKLFPVFIFLFVSVLFFSCKKETEKELESFELQVEVVDGKYLCSWTQTNISSFEQYILVYSPTPFEANMDPVSTTNQKIITDKQNENNHTWSLQPISAEFYFKVFSIFENRILESNQVKFVDENIQEVSFHTDRVIHYEDNNALYFYDSDAQRMLFYDYKTKERKAEREIGFNYSKTISGDNGFGKELYLVRGGNIIMTLDANTLAEKSSYNAFLTISSLDTNEKGLIALAVQHSFYTVRILDRNDWSVADEFSTFINNANLRGIAFLSKENNELVETGIDQLSWYEMDDSGNLIDYSLIGNSFPTYSNSNYTKLLVSPKGSYFVNSRHGEMYTGAYESMNRLYPITGNTYDSYLFNEEETAIYTITLPNSNNSVFIEKISLPDQELLEQVKFSDLDPKLLFLDEGKVMLVATGETPNDVIVRPLGF